MIGHATAHAKRLKLYPKLKREFLAKHFMCQCCYCAPAADIHHTAGRSGKLLIDVSKWKSLCRECHNMAHAYPAWARDKGLLAEKGKWNVQ